LIPEGPATRYYLLRSSTHSYKTIHKQAQSWQNRSQMVPNSGNIGYYLTTTGKVLP